MVFINVDPIWFEYCFSIILISIVMKQHNACWNQGDTQSRLEPSGIDVDESQQQ